METCETMELKNQNQKKSKPQNCTELKYWQIWAILGELVKCGKLREACFIILMVNTPLNVSQVLQLKLKNFEVEGYITGKDTNNKEWTIKLGDGIYNIIRGYLSNKKYIKDSDNRETLLFGAERTKNSGATPIKEFSMFCNINNVVKRKFFLVDEFKSARVNNVSLKSIYWKNFNKYWEKQQEQKPYAPNIKLGLDDNAFADTPGGNTKDETPNSCLLWDLDVIEVVSGSKYTGSHTYVDDADAERNILIGLSGECGHSDAVHSTVVIPSQCEVIWDDAFSGETNLVSVTIPGSVAVIGTSAFSGCTNLQTLNLGEGIKDIGNWAFKKCRSLTSVSIPNSVTSIGSDAFDGCRNLSAISAPASLRSSESDWLGDCDATVTYR